MPSLSLVEVIEAADTLLNDLVRLTVTIRKASKNSYISKADDSFTEDAEVLRPLEEHLTHVLLSRPEHLDEPRRTLTQGRDENLLEMPSQTKMHEEKSVEHRYNDSKWLKPQESAQGSVAIHTDRLAIDNVWYSGRHGMLQPPSAPNPAGDAGVLPEFGSLTLQEAPSPPTDEEELDLCTMSRESAMKLISRAIIAIANAAGNLPATPPLTRSVSKDNIAALKSYRLVSSRPATPILANKENQQLTQLSPAEAEHDEPTIATDIGVGALPEHLQRANMARKFFSKTVPKIGVEEYMNRIQKYCPLSTAVWLAAGSYILRLCVIDKVVPLTFRTMHRLILACALVAMKALEDHRWPQKRFAAVGGVDEGALCRLELCVEFQLSFNIQIFSLEKLKDLTISLQKAGQAATTKSRLPSSFPLKPGAPELQRRVAA